MRNLLIYLLFALLITLASCGDSEATPQPQNLLTINDLCTCSIVGNTHKTCSFRTKPMMIRDSWGNLRTINVRYPVIMCGFYPCNNIQTDYIVNCRRF